MALIDSLAPEQKMTAFFYRGGMSVKEITAAMEIATTEPSTGPTPERRFLRSGLGLYGFYLHI